MSLGGTEMSFDFRVLRDEQNGVSKQWEFFLGKDEGLYKRVKGFRDSKEDFLKRETE